MISEEGLANHNHQISILMSYTERMFSFEKRAAEASQEFDP